jgi:hypothetical protein
MAWVPFGKHSTKQAGSKPPAIHVSLIGTPRGVYRFFIEDGHHRVRAARLAGHGKILARIVEPGALFLR